MSIASDNYNYLCDSCAKRIPQSQYTRLIIQEVVGSNIEATIDFNLCDSCLNKVKSQIIKKTISEGGNAEVKTYDFWLKE